MQLARVETSTSRTRKFRRLRRLDLWEHRVEIDGAVLALLIRSRYLTEEESADVASTNAALTAYLLDSAHGRIRCPHCGFSRS
jgi:hypothetical protein